MLHRAGLDLPAFERRLRRALAWMDVIAEKE